MRDATIYCIPDGTINIPANAFRGNNNLVSVDIPDSVKRIGNGVFKGCRIFQFH